MLNKLKRHLTFLSGLTTSIILTIVVILTFFISFNQENIHNSEMFNKNVDELIENIRYSNMINHNYLNEMENDNNFIICVENQGCPLSFNGYIKTPTNRNTIIKQVKDKALKEGIDSSLIPTSSRTTRSSIFRINVGDNEYYKGLQIILPDDYGWKTLIVVEWIPNRIYNISKQILFFLTIDIIGCILLFIFSNIYISKAMTPVIENQKRQIDFVAAASHELRSPLTVVKAAVSSIKDDIDLADAYLPNIESELNRMTRLISDMLLLATSDAQTWSLNKEQIDMDTFLIETYDLFCPVVSSNNQNLSFTFPEKEALHTILADKERLKQLLTLLIDNAMEYTPKNQNITINAYNKKNSICIEIIDHGTGISNEQKELIFNRFYRGDKSRTSKKHFGLGLNIALELVNLHKGKIYIKDTPGGGATFTIEIPC